MTTETTAADVDPRALPADNFTASDRARIELGSRLESVASDVEGMALLLGAVSAVAGDYIRRACEIERSYQNVINGAVIAEGCRSCEGASLG